MKRNGYSPALVILALLWLLAVTAGPALALPSTDATIVDPYKDGRNVTLGQLSNKTATNSPQEPSREHDPSKTQAQLETTLTTDANLGFLTGGPHGRYADNTAACGRCHQLHQAQGQRLITRFCATCHWDYKATTAVSKTGAYDLKYRHKMGMGPNEGLNDGSKGFGYTSAKFELPLATIDMGPPGVVACITCHYAHGTFAVVNGISATDSIIISSADNSLDLQNLDGTKTEPPKNLRMDNRGVCQNCHNWPDVNTTPLALQDVLDPNQSGTVLYGEPGTLLAGTKILSPTPDTVTIRFNQYVLKGTAAPNSAEYTGNYTLVRTSDSAPVAISSATVQPEGRTVVLRLGSNLVTGTTYTLTVQNVQDTNFVAMNLFSQNFTK